MVARPVSRLVSGGQTGADRAALDAGLALGIPIGGWCPAGGWAEDLTDPPGLLALYPSMRETTSSDPDERTELNVRDSDATLILVASSGLLSAGTAFTLVCARRLGKPHLVATPTDVDAIRDWLAGLPADLVLNVAGPRESQASGHQQRCYSLLVSLLG